MIKMCPRCYSKKIKNIETGIFRKNTDSTPDYIKYIVSPTRAKIFFEDNKKCEKCGYTWRENN